MVQCRNYFITSLSMEIITRKRGMGSKKVVWKSKTAETRVQNPEFCYSAAQNPKKSESHVQNPSFSS